MRVTILWEDLHPFLLILKFGRDLILGLKIRGILMHIKIYK